MSRKAKSLGLGQLALVLALTLVVGACSDTTDDAEREVCVEKRRTLLVAEKLTRLVPSTPFEIGPGGEAWLSVVEDVDFNPSALFPSVATLYLIEEGSEPQIRDDANGLPIIDDPAIPFDAEGEWRPATAVPGRYQIWSRRGPVIEVASCPAPAAGD